jgi:electron-transferring-flavoprotein dehydrogenase
VLLSNINHEENPPGTLPMKDAKVPIKTNLALYGAPEPRCAPAGVH